MTHLDACFMSSIRNVQSTEKLRNLIGHNVWWIERWFMENMNNAIVYLGNTVVREVVKRIPLQVIVEGKKFMNKSLTICLYLKKW